MLCVYVVLFGVAGERDIFYVFSRDDGGYAFAVCTIVLEMSQDEGIYSI